MNEFKYTGLCLNITGGCRNSEPSPTQHSPLSPLSGRRHSQSLQSGDQENGDTRKPFTAQDFSIWYDTSTKLRDILSMQLDCLTAESAPLFSVVYVVPNAVSLCPALTFLFLSTFYSPAFCSVSPLWDSSRVLTPPNRQTPHPHNPSVLLPSLCSPPLSPSSCLVFSWAAVSWACCWQELCTIGHEGMKICSQAAEFTRLQCTENTCLQNCDARKTNQHH